MTNQPTRTKAKVRPEIQAAAKVYRWLWLSPFLTVPTLIILYFTQPGYSLICQGNWQTCNRQLANLVTGLVAVFGSALWHLVLLGSAFNKQSEFVRWHGRQALLLAVIRTLIALPIPVGIESDGGYLFLLILIAVWLFGTPWGQGQAKRGECTLMRWTGVGGHLPLAVYDEIEDELPKRQLEPKTTVDELVDVIRFNPDPQLRSTALAKLNELGYVEPL